MAESKSKPKYIFINPNTPEEFEKALKQVVIEKLLSLHIKEQPTLS